MSLNIPEFYKVDRKSLIFIVGFFTVGYAFANYFYKQESQRYVSSFMVKLAHAPSFQGRQVSANEPVEDIASLLYRIGQYNLLPEELKKICSIGEKSSFLNSIQVLTVKSINNDLLKIKISGNTKINIIECSNNIFKYIHDTELAMVREQYLNAQSIVEKNNREILNIIDKIQNLNSINVAAILGLEHIRILREESVANKRIIEVITQKKAQLISAPNIQVESFGYTRNIVSFAGGVLFGIFGFLIVKIFGARLNYFRCGKQI